MISCVFEPGFVLDGRYEIVGPLAAGGMGEVYRAKRRLLGDEVAIKIIRPTAGASGDGLRERFMHESRTCASLRHPGIVSILDFNVDGDGHPFLVMELLSGPSLRSQIEAGGSMRLPQVQSIVREVCDALQLAHDRGVVHRDLKPANIVAHQYAPGEIAYKVIDFGLANLRMPSESTRLTLAHQFVGTVAYASPEQLNGEDVDARADVYSMGVVIFEMLTGRVPFEGDSPMTIIGKHLTSDPPAPSALCTGLPEWVDRAVLKALAKDRGERWSSVRDLAAALGEAEDTGAHDVPALDGLLGTYELGERLGPGRLGSEVYAGVHRALGYPVAIRTLRRANCPQGWEARRERFLKEARALQVAHPSIMYVRDYGEAPDLVYVVTDLFEGTSLRERIEASGAVAWPQLSRFVRQIADAAATLNRRGTFICGVSPEIIRLAADEDGERLIISSAGISQIQDLLATLNEQTLRGTAVLDAELPYVAPEVLLGGALAPASDVFTIGVLAYEMAAGRRPFEAETMQGLLGAALGQTPPDPRACQAALPEAACAAMLRCLSRERDKRFASAREFLGTWGAIA